MIIERELGETVPISIGTAIAMEELLNSDEISELESIWFNVRTLLRNLVDSCGDHGELDSVHVVSDLIEELIVLEDLFQSGSGKHIEANFYINSHKSLAKKFPLAKIKTPRTEKQLAYTKFEEDVIGELKDTLESRDIEPLKEGDCDINGEDKRGILLTHIPMDLLSRYSFSSLILLESHTGRRKPSSQWNTKLTGGNKNNRIPFNGVTLQLFGDNATLFYGWPLKYKKAFLELAEIDEWNATTTRDRIMDSIKNVIKKDPFLYNHLAELNSATPKP